MKIEHCLYVYHHRFSRFAGYQFRIGTAFHGPLLHAPADWQITIDRVVRRGLVGDQIGFNTTFHQLGQNFAAITEQTD